MSDGDDLTKQLLTDYIATAENLQHGVNVSLESMNRFHGMTGKLLAHTIENLWTQQELDAQIDERVSKRCAACDKAKEVAVPTTAWGVFCANFRTIFIGVTIMVSVATACGRLSELKDFFRHTGETATELATKGQP